MNHPCQSKAKRSAKRDFPPHELLTVGQSLEKSGLHCSAQGHFVPHLVAISCAIVKISRTSIFNCDLSRLYVKPCALCKHTRARIPVLVGLCIVSCYDLAWATPFVPIWCFTYTSQMKSQRQADIVQKSRPSAASIQYWGQVCFSKS